MEWTGQFNRQRQQHPADQGGNGQVQQTGKTVVQGKNGQVQQTVTTAFYRSRREWTGQFNRQWQQHPTDQGENGQVSSTDSNNSILRSRKRMNRFNRQWQQLQSNPADQIRPGRWGGFQPVHTKADPQTPTVQRRKNSNEDGCRRWVYGGWCGCQGIGWE